MFDAWPRPKVGAALADQLQRQRGAKSMDLCQIRSQNRIQGRVQIEGRRIDLAAFRSCLWQHRYNARGKHGQRGNCRLKLAITFGKLGLIKVVEVSCLTPNRSLQDNGTSGMAIRKVLAMIPTRPQTAPDARALDRTHRVLR